ncbi:amidase domain-containing protein [Ditylenchus destructor]|uniref:Amidase domain-containing protein n=1 Tax=Ditylenchus destructor TaxID=166010 RepID=A0AAD4N2Y2_9BILA|nr:amidase domain-containing protein [Ditylenchus destructor]
MDRLFTYFYPILWILSRLYFQIVNIAFDLVNFVIPKTAVDPLPNDETGHLLLLSATKSAEMIRTGEITSSKLVQDYINRIKQVNPLVNAVVTEMFDEAMEGAEKVDQYLANLNKDGQEFEQTQPLLGIPCTIKDNIKVQGCVSLAGNREFVNNMPNDRDAELVKRLRDAGAIILATTNLPLFGNGWECESVVTGRTSNPYDLRRSPGGSSGGEAALIGSAASLFGIGNDYGGSIRLPSYMCGIFGLKPSKDIVPLDGTITDPTLPNLKRVNVDGTMCRFAEDLGLILKVLVGENIATNTLNLDRTIDLSKIRIFYMEELNTIITETMHSEPRAALREAVRYFENKYAIHGHRMDLPLAHRVFELYCAVVAGDELIAESSASFPQKFGKCIKNVAQFLFRDINMTSMTLEYNVLSTMIFDGPEKFAHFQEKCEKLREQVISLLADDGVLLFPVLPTLAPYHKQIQFTQFNFTYTSLFSALRLPSVACPLGLDPHTGTPLGIQIIGKPHSEALLITVAQELEKGFGGWAQPGTV